MELMELYGIPDELRALQQWHNWIENSEGTKIPTQVTGEVAKSNDPNTWSDFQTASRSGRLAFEITSPYTGVDLDNCLDERGKLRDWAIPIVSRLDGVSYAEISPSGRGIKFLTRARKPSGSRCVAKMAPDKQQLECYDHARFWTVTGDIYNRQTEIGDGQEVIDWLCGKYLAAPRQEVASVVVTYQPGKTSLEQRAEAYVLNAESAGTGQRNNSAFRLAGHLWSMTGDHGERLSEDQILGLMRFWNSRNLPPMSDNEIQHVTSSAARNGTPRPVKAPQMVIPAPDPAVDLSGILRQFDKMGDVPKSFPPECLEIPGLIGDLIQYNLRTARYPLPELALAGALSLMSAVTGGKIEYRGSRSNLYIAGLAPSGGGKDYARKINRKVLLQAGHQEICGPERIGSHAGIISALAENWNTMFQIDEISKLLATMQNAQMSPHLYNVASVLMQLYSSADSVWQADAYGDRKKCKTLEYPHCVVYGTSVPDGFWESLTKSNLSDGLIGRFLVFEERSYVDYQDPVDEDPPESIVERAKHWIEYRPGTGNLAGHSGAHPQKIEADEAAFDRLHRHALEISDRRKHEDPVTAAIWSRHAEKTNKLAMIFAASRWGPERPFPTIRLADADLAVRLNNWVTRRVLAQASAWVAETQTERDTLRILRMLSEGELSQSEIARKARWLKARDRRDILLSLQESGDIVAEERSTGGRTAVFFRRA